MAKDLTHTRFSQPIHDFFIHAAQGNDSSVTVKSIELDGTKLSVSVDVRSRQVAKVHVPFDGTKNIVVYDVTGNATFTEDLATNTPNVIVTFDGPHGIKIKVNVGELIQLLFSSGILSAAAA